MLFLGGSRRKGSFPASEEGTAKKKSCETELFFRTDLQSFLPRNKGSATYQVSAPKANPNGELCRFRSIMEALCKQCRCHPNLHLGDDIFSLKIASAWRAACQCYRYYHRAAFNTSRNQGGSKLVSWQKFLRALRGQSI